MKHIRRIVYDDKGKRLSTFPEKVSNEVAVSMVAIGAAHYVPKSTYKAFTRNWERQHRQTMRI